MEQVIFARKNTKLLGQLYSDFDSRYQTEQAMLSDLSNEMHEDAIRFLNLNELEKAQTSLFALASWLSRDVQYFMKMKNNKQRMYEYDLVSSLQLMGQLINICEDFKQWDIAFELQREYAKLNIRYSLMREAA
jgi:hypothetical protein